jgi:hypothetical protein
MLATANAFVRSGWDVTVLTLTESAWLREQGLDRSLSGLVDPRIVVERLPLFREDLETDIRTYAEERAINPGRWLRQHRIEDEQQFPEPVFGRWHDELIASAREVSDRFHPDLVLTSATPYTFFAPAHDLWQRDGIPYVLDYRDAWAIDILRDTPAFAPGSRAGLLEAQYIEHATEAWFVNQPIRDAYADLYPSNAAKLHILRNGSDIAVGTSRIPLRKPQADQGLTFGYLGTVTFDARRMHALCEGWRLAAADNELIRRSTLVFRGHLGTGSARGVTPQAAIIAAHERYGVSFGGPVAKADTAAVYESWDALVLSIVGGRYVTSGKVFDYISTGLPVMSVHEWDHAAVEILEDYPLWVRNDGVEAEDLAEAFIQTAELSINASIDDRHHARRYAERFERYAQIQPAVDRLTRQWFPELAAQPHQPQVDPPAKPEPEVHTESPPPAPHAEGERVVVVHTAPVNDVVAEAVHLLRRGGAHVHVICPATVASPELAGVADSITLVNRATAAVPVQEPLIRYTPKWGMVVARNLTRRHIVSRFVGRRGVPAAWWAATKRNPEAMSALASATVLVSLDPGAIYTVWNACRINTRAPAISGIGPALEHLGLTRS